MVILRRCGRALVASLVAALLTTAGAWIAVAAPGGGLDIDHVETAEDGTVSVLVGVDAASGGPGLDLASIRVQVDGKPVEAVAEAAKAGQLERTTILALDTSLSMRGERFRAATAAARAFLESAPEDVRIGLVTFAGKVRTLAAPTTDHDRVAGLVADLHLTGGTHVHDAVVAATRLAGTDGARHVLVLSDGQDQGSTIPLEAARSAAVEAEVVVDVVALDRRSAERDLLGTVARATGGDVVDADSDALAAAFEDQADALANQVLVRFPRPEDAGEEVQLQVSAQSAGRAVKDSAFVALPAVAGSETPRVSEAGEPLVGRTAMLIGAAGMGLGLAMLLGVALLGRRGPTSAQRRLSTYLGEDTATPHGTAGVRASAVGLAEAVVTEERGEQLRRRLQGAGMSIAPAEWVLLHVGAALLPALVGLVLAGPVLMVLLLLAGAVVPWFYLRHKHTRRLSAFSGQLPETLTLMAGGLSAGLSLPQAVDTVVQENQEPMAGELRRALVEQRLGLDVEDALEAVADRMSSEDFSWVVMAVRIQREVGGNLSEILNTVGDTLREREYLRRQVRSLSAEGRLSGWILGGLPPFMFLYMVLTNRDYVSFFWTDGVGVVMLAGAVLTLAVGAWFMSRLVKVQV